MEMVVGLLGVLGAGGAYLPLEPSLPRQRLAMILEDAQPAVAETPAGPGRLLPFPPDCLPNAGFQRDSRRDGQRRSPPPTLIGYLTYRTDREIQ